MKKRFIRHGFNMVEVALALAIIAIGISSILVLFPVGANANKAAIANNNLADIAEYMMSYIRAGVTSEGIANAERSEGAPENNFFTDNIKKRTSGNASTPSSWYPDTADKGLVLDWKEVGSDKYEMTVKEAGSSSSIGSQITENLYTLDSDNRAFLFTQISGGNIDFARRCQDLGRGNRDGCAESSLREPALNIRNCLPAPRTTSINSPRFSVSKSAGRLRRRCKTANGVFSGRNSSTKRSKCQQLLNRKVIDNDAQI